MFTPLVPIKINSIYDGPLPSRMAKCTPDMYTAIFAVKQHLESEHSDLVLSDLFRSYEMQLQAHLDYTSGKKSAYSPPPGGSMHEAGRAFDLDLKLIRKLTLEKFWAIAAARGLQPIITTPNIKLNEAWHFDCRGSHQAVYTYYQAGHGDNFQSPYAAMAASAILSIGQKVDVLGDEVLPGYIQSALIRLGQTIGDLDGRIGPATRAALTALEIDAGGSLETIAEALDTRLQEKFPREFFTASTVVQAEAAPRHLVVNLHAAATAPVTMQDDLGNYRPHPDTLPQLGGIVAKLREATVIAKNFVHPPRLLARLASGELYFDSNLELDTDGWPEGGQHGESSWQPDTSLRYADSGSLNANAVPYFVLPLPTTWPQQFGISLGDYAAVLYRTHLAFAVFGDQGPKNKLGEGSLELLRRLGQDRIRPNGSVLNAGMGPGVITIVFPGSGAVADRKNPATLLQAIAEKAKTRFETLRTADPATRVARA